MPLQIQGIQELQNYLNGVIDRADHHAEGVREVALALMGAIIWRADNNLRVRGYAGRPGNIIWFDINETTYVLAFNHSESTIELRERTQNGNTIQSFDNSTTNREVIEVFRNL